VARNAPAARVDAQAGWLTPVFSAIHALQWLAGGLIALLALATVAAVLLASRNALGNHRDTIEIVHMLGGTDNQIARIFQRAWRWTRRRAALSACWWA
jgi:cell division transport system permease protein